MHLEVMQDKCRGKAAPIVYSSQAPGPGVAVGRTLRQYNAAYEGEQMYRWLLILNPLPPNVSTLATTTAILAPPPLKNHPHCTHQDDNKDCGSRIVMIRVPNWVICPTHGQKFIQLQQQINAQLEYCKLAVAMTLAYNFWLYELYSIYI
ncbi:hypothetical protein SERLADRAFT_404754 [Serpula lacrymans var. lacrymans S7.9]|uniref:Uncharacterized protein n=1 Tax=Serpula lacrymans var. lacrymans (strain S7.9) TaxID=578457 RepID=F8NER1_SERL9|nr:uncharacterized protein SERLADRAFT_404754 [Serpula lacrymans var. lacrymans S7.9]EGO30695.1 hypothetical protein SERLADRAFT_404754 [Serpula lacrymans var. lacrymans S7.9]